MAQCEDAAVGLCAHLLQVPLVDTACILGGTVGQLRNARQALALIRKEQESKGGSCRAPFAVHPVKTRLDYLHQMAVFRKMANCT